MEHKCSFCNCSDELMSSPVKHHAETHLVCFCFETLDINWGTKQQRGADCVGYGALIAVVVLGFLHISFISRDDVT
jgi:hypothetical protein